MNEVRVGKLPIIKLPIVGGYTFNLFQNYFKGVNIWWLFAQLYKNFTHCFVLQVSIGNRF